MSNVIINKDKLDTLATAISLKTGDDLPLTLAEMTEAVDDIIVPFGTKSISANGTGIDVTAYAAVDVAVSSSGGVFVVTLTLNSQTGYWEPDKTYAQIVAAYNNGDTIVVSASYSVYEPWQTCNMFFDNDDFYYSVAWYDYSEIVDGHMHTDAYVLNSNGLTLDDRQTYDTPMTLVAKTITANGTYNPIITDSADGYSSVTVNVPTPSPSLQAKTNITPTTSSQTITADSGYDGLSSVQINAMPSGSATTPATTITANPTISISGTGLITATTSASQSVTPTVSVGYVSSGTAGTVTVSGSNTSQLSTQAAATITPTESSQTAVAAGKYTTGAVTVAAIPSNYVGSGIDQRDDTDLTVSGATVTVPAGYYASQETKSVANGTEGTPTVTKGTVSNHAISVTPSVTNTAGYINGGTNTGTAVSVTASELVSGTLTIDSSGTKDVTNYASASVAAGTATAPSSISGSAATVSTGTNTLTLTKTVSVTPNISTAGYISSGTAGNSSVSLTANVTTKAAATITPGTTNQTIAAGTYLTGTQTISGDANLVSSNIISGKSIFGVSGSVAFQTIYSGSSDPVAATGANGDIYIKVVS